MPTSPAKAPIMHLVAPGLSNKHQILFLFSFSSKPQWRCPHFKLCHMKDYQLLLQQSNLYKAQNNSKTYTNITLWLLSPKSYPICLSNFSSHPILSPLPKKSQAHHGKKKKTKKERTEKPNIPFLTTSSQILHHGLSRVWVQVGSANWT